jgi:uncharacterized membrane protein
MKWLLAALVIGYAALHQDIWNWTNRTLVGGVLPMGLAYHAMYSIGAAVLMAVLVRFAWPSELETVQPEPGVVATEEGGH